MKIVLFLGYSGSGKTTSLTSILYALRKTCSGKIGAVKRVHDSNFTIDTKGKDTWFYASAGASVIVALAHKDISQALELIGEN